MKATDRCLNCGELTTGKVYCDELGPFMSCEHCGGSFDTDQFYKVITHKEASEIIKTREPRGLFLEHLDSGKCVGIDNLTGDAWVEEFDDETTCYQWLAGVVKKEDEVDDNE